MTRRRARQGHGAQGPQARGPVRHRRGLKDTAARDLAEAARKRQLCKFREGNGLVEQINLT